MAAVHLGAVTEAFELGTVTGPARALSGGGLACRWRLDTVSGRWMVKTRTAPAAWEREQMRHAGTLESAARAAGVMTPRPLTPREPGLGFWQAVDGGWARVSQWVEGSEPTSATVPFARWLGGTLAVLDGLALVAGPATGAGYRLHAMDDWRRWFAAAREAGLLDRGETTTVLAAVADATGLVTAALARRPVLQLGHRDAHSHNVLLTAGGPVLIDFDSAGPEVPWWGTVSAAWELARPDLHRLAPAVLGAYADRGGRRGPAEPSAFAGQLRRMLDGLSSHVRRATGDVPAAAGRVANSRAELPRWARGLPEVLTMLDDWVDLLRRC